jgi:hypothetical protein
MGGKACGKAQMLTKRSFCLRKTTGGPQADRRRTGKWTCKHVEKEENHEKGPRWSWAQTRKKNE